jgi:hypothetical protein
MDLNGGSDIERALQGVGEILASEGQAFAIVVIGGAALNLLGIIERSTTDVDILALALTGAGQPHELQRPPEPLPQPLVRAALAVARDMGLRQDWLNAGPSLQWQAGLPPGLEQRVHWLRYSALSVGVVDRQDLILFKLFAAADSAGPGSVHYQDLRALDPTAEELDAAKSWVITQDASTAFAEVLDQVIECVQMDLINGDKSRRTSR